VSVLSMYPGFSNNIAEAPGEIPEKLYVPSMEVEAVWIFSESVTVTVTSGNAVPVDASVTDPATVPFAVTTLDVIKPSGVYS